MGLFSSGSSKDVEKYKAAKRDLERLAKRERRAGIKHETDAFNRANHRVVEAEKNVPWWRR